VRGLGDPGRDAGPRTATPELTSVRPTGAADLGIHGGDKDDMVEEDAAIVRGLLEG